MSTTAVKGFTDEAKTKTETPRRERQIYNRMKYRLNKRRNLYLRAIASAKSAEKVKVNEARIAVLDFALAELEAV